MPTKDELKKVWNKLPPNYYENGNLGQRLWHEIKFMVVKSVFPKDVSSLADVGCADGYFLRRIANLVPEAEVYGLDVSEKLIKAARVKYSGIKFIVADAHKLPFKKHSLDLIISTETLEHVVNPQKVLSEVKRVIKPKGKIIIELDSGSWLFRLIFGIWVRFFKGRIWEKAHLHQFTAAQLEKLFEKGGLKVKKKVISHFGMAVTYLLERRQ